jgi:hypothetical protein
VAARLLQVVGFAYRGCSFTAITRIAQSLPRFASNRPGLEVIVATAADNAAAGSRTMTLNQYFLNFKFSSPLQRALTQDLLSLRKVFQQPINIV